MRKKHKIMKKNHKNYEKSIKLQEKTKRTHAILQVNIGVNGDEVLHDPDVSVLAARVQARLAALQYSEKRRHSKINKK